MYSSISSGLMNKTVEIPKIICILLFKNNLVHHLSLRRPVSYCLRSRYQALLKINTKTPLSIKFSRLTSLKLPSLSAVIENERSILFLLLILSPFCTLTILLSSPKYPRYGIIQKIRVSLLRKS